MKVLLGSGAVQHLAVAANGRWLAAAGPAGLTVWDWPTGQVRLRCPAWRAVTGLAFCDDGRLLVAFGSGWYRESGFSAGAIAYDPHTSQFLPLDVPNRVYAVTATDAHTFLAVGYTTMLGSSGWAGKTVSEGDLSTGRRQRILGVFEGVFRFARLDAMGRRALLGLGAEDEVGLWDLRPLRSRFEIRLHAAISAAVLAPRGDAFAIAAAGAITHFADDAFDQAGDHGASVHGLAFHPSGRLLASAGADGHVAFWRRGRLEDRFDWGLGPLTAIAFDAQGMLAAASAANGRIVVWDVEEG